MNRFKTFVQCGSGCLAAVALLSSCSRLPLLDPKGPIGATERFVILVAIALMMIVVVPVVVMVFWFSRKYRASNIQAAYMPKWGRSGKIEWVIWLVPVIIVSILGTLIWITTHRLDPYEPVDSGVAPLRIEAVSMDWKWLFIYPDLGVATVNRLVFPVHVPLEFRLTSDTVMTSFFIPRLGSQIYAMAGMQTRLHLLADYPGVYAGQNQQFSGRGYAEMNFEAIATSAEEFQRWLRQTRQSPDKLDLVRYRELAKPSIDDPVALFSRVKPDLFDHILHQYGKTRSTEPGGRALEPKSGTGLSGPSEAG